MTAVPVYLCDAHEARELTEQIKTAADRVWNLLHRAHDQRAWAALGYDTWADYVKAEFDMSRSRSYELLDQARVIRAIDAAVDVRVPGHASVSVSVSAEAARDVKPVLAAVVDDVEQQVQDIRDRQQAEPAQEQIEQAVAQAVERGRALATEMADRKKRSAPAMAAALAAVPDDFDPADNEARTHALGAVMHAVEGVAALTYEPADLGGWAHPTSLYHFTDIRRSIAFLTDFAAAVEARS